MHELLQNSKNKLLKPSQTAKRRVLITLNITYIIATCIFLAMQKVHSGILVHNIKLFYFGYLPALALNFLSLVYHIVELFKTNLTKKINGNVLAICSIVPVFFMSFLHQIGYGNPGSDAILSDYSLAVAFILVAAMVINRKAAIIWSVILLGTLGYNVSLRGINYQYHYLTPNEVIEYEAALARGDVDALQRQRELKEANLNPPQIKRYTLQWSIFIVITVMAVIIFAGANKKVVHLVNPVINEIEKESLKLARKKAALEKEVAIKTEKQKLSNLREQTFINLAHELRTPLTLINNALDEYIASHEANKELEVIKLHTHKLTRDIVHFFDLERLEKGFERYDHSQVVNFSETLYGYLILFEPAVKKKGLLLMVDIMPDVFIKADTMALGSIIKNLLENALKYTHAKHEISISLMQTDKQVVFKVLNTGVGIPEAAQKKVFQPYYQIRNEKKRNEGMGLGLPIVKRIVDQLGGEIHLHSKLDEYTLFNITLPITQMVTSTGIPADSLSPVPCFSFEGTEIRDMIQPACTKQILVVEDNTEMLKYTVAKLSLKFNVYAAKSAGEALQKLATVNKIDLIISDVMMREMDGITFYKELSNNPDYQHIPFIFVSAKAYKKNREEALALGAIDYIAKPFSITELFLKVGAILNNQEKQLKTFGDNLVKQTMTSFNEKHSSYSTQLKSNTSFEATCKGLGLTSKETEVAQFIAKGYSYKQIADTLNRSERTVQSHVKRIFKKAGVKNKVELLKKLGFS